MAQDKQSTHFNEPIDLPEVTELPLAAKQEDEPIPLVIDDEPMTLTSAPHAQAPAAQPMGAAQAGTGVRAIKSSLDAGKRTKFKRQTVNTGAGAVRCRLFHCKVAESSMEHMQDQINTWLDDEEIDVKHVGHMVGMLEGKHTEPNIIVMLWY